MNREEILSALAKRIEAIPRVRTFSRKLKHWADVPKDEQPALFMAKQGESIEIQGRGIPPKHRMPVSLYLYSQNEDAALQNNLLDAIEKALATSFSEGDTLTLGGLVNYCRIEGDIETDEGLLGEQAVAIIPVMILVP